MFEKVWSTVIGTFVVLKSGWVATRSGMDIVQMFHSEYMMTGDIRLKSSL